MPHHIVYFPENFWFCHKIFHGDKKKLKKVNSDTKPTVKWDFDDFCIVISLQQWTLRASKCTNWKYYGVLQVGKMAHRGDVSGLIYDHVNIKK